MIPVQRAHLHVSAATHPGMKGKNNEDRYAVSAHRVGPDDPAFSVLAVLSDGVGGHRAGEVAAEYAVETVSRVVAESSAQQPLEILKSAFEQASKTIMAQATSNMDLRGMGATCVCAWVIGDRLFTASAGDSRLYLIRGHSIRQLTTDHTWIQEAIDYGALTPEQARNHPNAHIIRRFLGSSTQSEPDFRLRLHAEESDAQAEANQGMHLLPGDILILCSDGLSDLVEKEEILSALRTHERQKALYSLINLANKRGGHDNITIIALEAPSGARPMPVEKTRLRLDKASLRHYGLPCLVIGMLLLITVLVAGGAIWLISGSSRVTPTPSPMPVLTAQPGLPPAPTLATPQSSPTAQPLTPAPTPATPQATYTPWPTNTPPVTDTPTGRAKPPETLLP